MTDGGGETILKRGRANFQPSRTHWEAAGGWAELTPTALTFRPHSFNATVTGPVRIDLRDVEGVEPVRMKVFGFIPSPFSNTFAVRGQGGGFEVVFVVTGRDSWIQAVNAARGQLLASRRPDAGG